MTEMAAKWWIQKVKTKFWEILDGYGEHKWWSYSKHCKTWRTSNWTIGIPNLSIILWEFQNFRHYETTNSLCQFMVNHS
jgi:hypothetical protein